MENLKKLFLDTEFTGLHQKTTLISLALVAETGEEFYAEFTDYDKNQVDDWLVENVISKLFLNDKNQSRKLEKMYIRGNRSEVKSALLIWLEQFGIERNEKKEIIPSLQIWADVLHYDWVLFCELFGGARSIPKQIHFKAMDLSTLLFAKGVAITGQNFELKDLIDEKDLPKNFKPHNALSDAQLGMKVLKKYMNYV